MIEQSKYAGKVFMYAGWPRVCEGVYEDGHLHFGPGVWDRNFTTETCGLPLSYNDVVSFLQHVAKVNDAERVEVILDYYPLLRSVNDSILTEEEETRCALWAYQSLLYKCSREDEALFEKLKVQFGTFAWRNT